MPQGRKRRIASILLCEVKELLTIYLGLPLGAKNLDYFWEELVDSFNRKLARWKGDILSQDGKIKMIKSTLQNLPSYALSLFQFPNKYAKAIEKIKKGSFGQWLKIIKQSPLYLGIKYSYLREGEGMEIRKLILFNNALFAKKIWRNFQVDGEWSKVLQSKYLFNTTRLTNFFYSVEITNGYHKWNSLLKVRKTIMLRIKWKF